MTGVSIRRWKFGHSHREETRNARDCEPPPEASRGKEGSYPGSCWQPDFGLPASRTVRINLLF